jgi:iron complex transport system substrate-binding protein
VVCLTEETTETLYRIGAGDLVVGVSGFTMRPPAARKKPKVSTFLDADFDRILDLRPDLVLGFSDLQADLAAELVRRGVAVHLFNQRSVAEILQAIRTVAGLVGRHDEGERLAAELTANLERLADAAPARRPRIFFEEWPDPLISGIRWVSELVELVGGEPLFPETRAAQGAAGRIVEPAAVVPLDPAGIVASWCGKKAVRRTIVARPG